MIQLFSQQIIDEMNSDRPRLIMAIEILYKSAPVRAHSGVGDIVIGGQIYTGVGVLGDISAIGQTSKTSPATVTVSMSGLDPTLVAETLNERTQGSKSKIMVCSLDDDDRVTSASIVFSGRVSAQRLRYGDSVTVESEHSDRLTDWQRKGSKRFDNKSHKAQYPNDDIFQYIPQMAEAPIYWGSKKDAPPMRYQ